MRGENNDERARAGHARQPGDGVDPADGVMLDNLQDAQIVIRPILTPDGQPTLWVMVNCPN
jgi:hypothetical protein